MCVHSRHTEPACSGGDARMGVAALRAPTNQKVEAVLRHVLASHRALHSASTMLCQVHYSAASRDMLEHYTCGLLALRTLEHVHLTRRVQRLLADTPRQAPRVARRVHALLTPASMAPCATSHDECSAARSIVLEYYTSHRAGNVHKYYTCMRAATRLRLILAPATCSRLATLA